MGTRRDAVQLFGTLEGDVSIVNHVTNRVIATSPRFSDRTSDAVLALCWYREENTKQFFAASGSGTIKLCEYDEAGEAPVSNVVATFRCQIAVKLASPRLNACDAISWAVDGFWFLVVVFWR